MLPLPGARRVLYARAVPCASIKLLCRGRRRAPPCCSGRAGPRRRSHPSSIFVGNLHTPSATLREPALRHLLDQEVLKSRIPCSEPTLQVLDLSFPSTARRLLWILHPLFSHFPAASWWGASPLSGRRKHGTSRGPGTSGEGCWKTRRPPQLFSLSCVISCPFGNWVAVVPGCPCH